MRYTRAHDGKLGRWEMHAETAKSKTGRKTLCYNADFMDAEGRHDIAAVAYPEVGMQSNLDPDYIEYQILSAKAAGIDGFFIEWGFMDHENDKLLKAMQPVAREIRLRDRRQLVRRLALLRLDYPHAPRDRHPRSQDRALRPLLPVSGGPRAVGSDGSRRQRTPGLLPLRSGRQTRGIRLCRIEGPAAEGMPQPAVLRRWAEWGTLENDRYVPVRWSPEIESWKELGMIPTACCRPACVRWTPHTPIGTTMPNRTT